MPLLLIINNSKLETPKLTKSIEVNLHSEKRGSDRR